MSENSPKEVAKVIAPKRRFDINRLVVLCQSRRFGMICLGLLVVVILILLIAGPGPEPEESLDDKTALELGIVRNGREITLPAYNMNYEEPEAQKPTGNNKPNKLPGPKTLARPRAAKIPPGSIVAAKLISGASNGPVKVILTESLKVNNEEIIEVGSTLIGQGESSEERLYVRFDKLIFPDGSVQEVQADAADPQDKIAGLKGSKVGSYATKMVGAVGLNFAGGMADGLQEQEAMGNMVVKKSTMKNALLNGASRAALEQSQEIMSEIKNSRPIIEVPEGTPLYVIFRGDG